MTIRLLSVLLFLCLSLAAQLQVDRRNLHERIFAVVPIIGTGTAEDPFRPAHTPAPPPLDAQTGAPQAQAPSEGIIGYSMVRTDDGKHAIVQLVARDRSAFKDLLTDNSPDVKAFEKGKAKREDIEAEFRKWKKDFTMDQLGGIQP